LLALAAGVIPHLAGCANGPNSPASASTATSPATSTVNVAGDWNDVAAALEVAIRDQGFAVLSETRGELAHEFELLTIRDEPGSITARRDTTDSASSITLTCRIGAVGDPRREQPLLAAMTKRLKDLAGVDYRPVR